MYIPIFLGCSTAGQILGGTGKMITGIGGFVESIGQPPQPQQG